MVYSVNKCFYIKSRVLVLVCVYGSSSQQIILLDISHIFLITRTYYQSLIISCIYFLKTVFIVLEGDLHFTTCHPALNL